MDNIACFESMNRLSTPPYMGNQGVYWILNKANGLVYVGSAKDIEERWYWHRYNLARDQHENPHLQAAWNLYGDPIFEFEVVELVEDLIWLRARETKWIKTTRATERGFGYNITIDAWSPVHLEPTPARLAAWKRNGEKARGRKDSSEVRARKSIAAQKRVAAGKGIPSHTSPHTKETKEKLSKARQARTERGDYHKFTPEQAASARILAAAALRQKWQDPVWREQQRLKQRQGHAKVAC